MEFLFLFLTQILILGFWSFLIAIDLNDKKV